MRPDRQGGTSATPGGAPPQPGGRAVRFRAAALAAPLALALLFPAAADAEPPRTYFGERYEEGLAAARKLDRAWHEGIRITGTPAFIARARAALDLIEAADSRSWYFTRKHVRRITLSGHAGMDVGGARVTAGDRPDERPADFAGRIVHEVCHAELVAAGKEPGGEAAEAACLARQNEFLIGAGLPPLDVERTLASRYWETDYWERDW